MKNSPPHILLVNPWIHDFAAYDVWSKPMGLLYLASILRDHGCKVSYIDCLDRFHPKAGKTDPFARYGRGPYHKTPLDPPKGLEHLGRNFSRYGIDPDWLDEDLSAIENPDLILTTSVMTYWAPGVTETILALKKQFQSVPVILGGIYATLCQEHAEKNSGADMVVSGEAEREILGIVKKYTGFSTDPKYDLGDINELPYPAYDLQRVINYIPLRTAKGCPFSCTYCASGFISPEWARRAPQLVFDEIKYWHSNHNVKDFAFYDDALLVDAENHSKILFSKIIDSGMRVRLHTPNAVHVRGINCETAELMYKAGFKTLRLGVESTDFQKRNGFDNKVSETDFDRAVSALKSAGFPPEQTGAYLLTGLPGQAMLDVETSVRHVIKSGITPVLTHYTPIPHTSMWESAKKHSKYNIEDPVFTNNSILPCGRDNFSWSDLSYLKKLIAGEKQ